MDGNRLKEARRARGLTQAELGRLVGVGKSAISQYEHGLRLPETAILVRLAGALGVSADWLLGLEDGLGTIAREARAPYQFGNPPPEDEEDEFLAELRARAGAITKRENRQTLLEMARFLAHEEAESREASKRPPPGKTTGRRGR